MGIFFYQSEKTISYGKKINKQQYQIVWNSFSENWNIIYKITNESYFWKCLKFGCLDLQYCIEIKFLLLQNPQDLWFGVVGTLLAVGRKWFFFCFYVILAQIQKYLPQREHYFSFSFLTPENFYSNKLRQFSATFITYDHFFEDDKFFLLYKKSSL